MCYKNIYSQLTKVQHLNCSLSRSTKKYFLPLSVQIFQSLFSFFFLIWMQQTYLFILPLWTMYVRNTNAIFIPTRKNKKNVLNVILKLIKIINKCTRMRVCVCVCVCVLKPKVFTLWILYFKKPLKSVKIFKLLLLNNKSRFYLSKMFDRMQRNMI